MRWARRPIEYLDDCIERYGELFTLRLIGHGPMVFCTHPTGIKQIFTAPADALFAGDGNRLLTPILGPNSLLLLDGPAHRRNRRLMMPPFHGKRMKEYATIIREATCRATEGWSAGDTLAIAETTKRISLEVILRAVYGFETNLDEASDRLLGVTNTVTPLLLFFPLLQRDLGPGSPGRKYRRAQAHSDALMYGQIRAYREQGYEGRKDILSLLMSARDEEGEGLSDEELRDQLLTLLAAGHETTAVGLAWAFHWLLSTPDSLAALLAELAPLGVAPDPVALTELPYLRAVCKESLRLVPTIPIVVRTVQEPFELMGHAIDTGMYVVPCIYGVHRREDVFAKADQFRPERFLNNKFSPYEFIPFGGGTRRCIGAAFAEFEMQIALGTLFAQYRFALDGDETRPTRRNVSILPKDGRPIRVTERRSSTGP